MSAPLRPELGPLPARLQRLPLDDRGYPVPWFVAWHDGKPEFRAMDPDRWRAAVEDRLCWVCGGRCGAHLSFLIGPMCGINRTTAEPGCHLECAEWSALHCPFMSRPRMVRREDEEINASVLLSQDKGAILRNPGVGLVWTTKTFSLFRGNGPQPLIHLGDPIAMRWFAEGRAATRAEVVASIESGLPSLLAIAEEQDRTEPWIGAVQELRRMTAAFLATHLPTDVAHDMVGT